MTRAIVAEDEPLLRDELVRLLRQAWPELRIVAECEDGASALEAIAERQPEVAFLDIRMPGLSGLEVAQAAAEASPRTQVVFVTAYDQHAVDAFELQATDYVMKPVRAERLSEAVRRVVESRDGGPDTASDDETIAVELGGVTRFVQRSQVRYVEAQGDYARLHTGAESHLVRIPLATLEERWGAAGFVRIHRSTLVALRHVDEVRSDAGRFTVRLGDDELVVSRRHTRELRDRLIRSARPGRP